MPPSLKPTRPYRGYTHGPPSQIKARRAAGDDTIQRLLADLEAARTNFAESVGRYRGNRLTAHAALATEAHDFRGSEAVALGLADATGHAFNAFESFVRAMNGKK